MRVFHADRFGIPLPDAHRFPLEKYRLLRERVAEAHGHEIELIEAPRASIDALCRVHAPEYVARVLNGTLTAAEQRTIGFPWSPELAERALRSVGATIAASEAALGDGCSVTLGGGTHHAAADRGSGYCLFNDVAAAARALQARPESLGAPLLIVDCDVHQGDGTASLFAGTDSVFTLSLHGARNFPVRKARSDLDVELPDGTEDADYLAALDEALSVVDQRFAPAAVFYLAGADPYANDRLGRLSLSIGGLAARDRRVLDWCLDRRLPVTVCMAGGYSDPVADTVTIHANTVREALAAFGRRAPATSAHGKPA